MSEQTVSFIKGRHGDIAVHDWGNDQPRYLALLIHGYGEHLGRYQYVARTLQAQGARVFGPDHLGHGLSQGERVLIEDYDAVVDDVQRVVSHFRQQYSTLPLVVIGHSMGGMIATRYVQRYGEVRALVLSGPLLGDRTAISDLAELPTLPTRRWIPPPWRAIRRSARRIRKIRWCGTGRSSAPPCAPCSGSSPPSTPGRASARYPRCGSTATTIGWC